MKPMRLKSAVLAALSMLALAGPVWADRDDRDHRGDRADQDRREQRDRGHDDRRDDRRFDDRRDRGDDRRYERGEPHGDLHFRDHDRVVIHDYFEHDYDNHGRCPPGLAKKHNGCMPPGQARRWAVGRPLPRDVIYYPLPPQVVIELGPPPPHHRYVRVASDILLIAIGTGMVVDAIEDLGR